MFRKTSAIAPSRAPNGGELVMMGPQSPVRVQETRRSGRSLEVGVPVAQSRHVALAWALVVGSSLFIVLAVGPVVYWLAAGIVAAAAFIWVLALAQKWEDGVTPSDLFAAFLLSALVGLVAWSLWTVAGYVGFSFALPSFWLKLVTLFAASAALPIVSGVACITFVSALIFVQRGENGITRFALIAAALLAGMVSLTIWSLWQMTSDASFALALALFLSKATMLSSILSFTFATVYASVLSLAFVQELAQRSPFQEQHGWRVIFDLLEWAVKERGNSRGDRDRVLHIYNGAPPARPAQRREDDGNGDQAAELWEKQAAEVVRSPDTRADILEFLVRGQRIVDDHGQPIRYNRRKWGGIRLSSSTVVSQNQAKVWARELAQAGILAETGTGLDLAPDLSLADALDHITIEYRIAAPHPTVLRKWATQGRIPTQPNPTQATQLG